MCNHALYFPHLRVQLGEASGLSFQSGFWIQRRGTESGGAFGLSAGVARRRRGELQRGPCFPGGQSPRRGQTGAQSPKDQLQGEKSPACHDSVGKEMRGLAVLIPCFYFVSRKGRRKRSPRKRRETIKQVTMLLKRTQRRRKKRKRSKAQQLNLRRRRRKR